ncbi:MAG: hypothetical protein WC381_11615, partial [Kiritimatiellia bacterium]
MMKKALWVAFLMVGTAGIGLGQQTKTVEIPGDAWTAYNIPEGGAALQLNINAKANCVIDDSTIQFEDNDAVDWWYDSDASSAAKRVYQIGTVLSSREYVRIFGHYHYTNGTSGGSGNSALPPFYARVAAPDVDVAPLTNPTDEDKEESVGVWLAKAGTRKEVTVRAVQCRSPSSSRQTLTWSGLVSLWTAAGGGSPLSSGAQLAADQGA